MIFLKMRAAPPECSGVPTVRLGTLLKAVPRALRLFFTFLALRQKA